MLGEIPKDHEQERQQTILSEPWTSAPKAAVQLKLLSQKEHFIIPTKTTFPLIIFLYLLFCANSKSHAPHLYLNCKGKHVMKTNEKMAEVHTA